MDNNISFKSNIKFIQPANIPKLIPKGVEINFRYPDLNIRKAKNFYTTYILTCTGGGVINNITKEAVGFHILDDKSHYKNFDKLINKIFSQIKPERGLLIGSKDAVEYGFEYSKPQFQKYKKVFSKKIDNLTIFEEHKYPYSQSHYAYSVDEDTWYICTEYLNKNNKTRYVSSIKRLKDVFKNIKIAKGDNLFIDGKKIKRKNAPELFA